MTDLFDPEEPAAPAPDERDWASENRARKVAAIVAHVDNGGGPPGVDPYAGAEDVARWLRELTDEEWLTLAQAAGFKSKKVPGPRTQGAVIEKFELRVDLAGEAGDAPAADGAEDPGGEVDDYEGDYREYF